MNTLKIKLYSLITLALFSLPASALTELSGDLESHLKNIDYGDKYDNSWVKPSIQQLASFESAITEFIAGNYTQADILGASIGYQVTQFTNVSRSPSEIHYILSEKNPLPSSTFIGGGTFVAFPGGLNAVLQAPHPMKDSFTSSQAIETYLNIKPALLMLAGTRRDSSTATSACTDGGYADSDVSHQTQSLFHAAHTTLSDYNHATVFIQFHGFGSSTLTKLQQQCQSQNSNLINLSEGLHYPMSQNEFSIIQILRSKVESGGIIKACVYGNDTNSLGGTWNVQGRYTNGSTDACMDNATTSSKRFIHLEQSYQVRKNHRADMSQYIHEAIIEYFQLN